MTLHPDVSAFQHPVDVVQRLLPYHVWQIPDQDLIPPGAKGKMKARARDWDWEELIQETPEEERAGEFVFAC